VFWVRALDDHLFTRFLRNPAFEGDEVNYLRMVHSLATDGDSNLAEFVDEDLRNQVEKATKGTPIRHESGIIFGRNGWVASVHLPGLSALLAPAYSIDLALLSPGNRSAPTLPFLPSRLPVTLAFMGALASAAILLMARLMHRFFDSWWIEAALVFLLITVSPFSGYAFQIYPEVPALVCALVATNALFFPFRPSWLNQLAFVLGVACLPWLHQRFALLGLGLVLAFFMCRREDVIREKKSVLPMGAALLLCALGYFYYFYSITGDPSPLSISEVNGKVYARLGVLRRGLAGHLLHHGNGMIWVYPWTALSVMGAFWGFKHDTRRFAALLSLAFPYYVIVSMAVPYSGITSPMGRFLVVLLPVFCILAGYLLQDTLGSRSSGKLLLYGLVLGLVLLNRTFWLVSFNYLPNLTVYNLKCAAAIASLLGLCYAADRWFPDRRTRSEPRMG
jgi:hypothetical protein